MEEKNIMYKKCEDCGREIKYKHEEGLYEVYPLDPQITMFVGITVILKDQEPSKDDVYQHPVKMIRRHLTVCGFDCFKKAVSKLKEEDFHD